MGKVASFFIVVIIVFCGMWLFKSAPKVEDDAAIFAAVSSSDDYNAYAEQFINVTNKLLSNSKCSKNDFVEYGGWVKSQNQKSEPVYFIYCGGMKAANKIYYNVKTGRIW